MNKVNWDALGGVGAVLDDFIKDGQNVRDVLAGLMTFFGTAPEDGFIISGCVVNWFFPTTYTAGWIYLNGEICQVAGGAVPALGGFGDVHYWDFDFSIDVSGNRLTENGAPITPYEIRNVKMVAGPLPTHYLPANIETPTLQSVLVHKISADNVDLDLWAYISSRINAALPAILSVYALKTVEAWKLVGVGANPAFLNGWSNGYTGTRNLGFRKNDMGMVSVKGWIYNNVPYVAGTHNIIFTLPVGYRPAFAVMKTAGMNTAGDWHDVIPIFVDTNGSVSISSNADSYGGALSIAFELEFYIT